MEFWIEKKQCTGCGACSNVCPKNAIKMEEDESGFKYPIINQDLCINCGMCKRTCPILEKKNNSTRINPKTYAAWSKDKDTRFNSTSGGLFTEIAKAVIKEKGYVVGAEYNEDNLVEHTIINKLEDIEKIRQSKYLQSDTKRIYKEAKEKLDNNSLLAFCGSPCQVAGLYKYLNKNYNNLLTIEFICRGMNSPKAYKTWLKEIEKKENKKVKKVWFKYKENGWKKSPKCTRIEFDDNTYKVYSNMDNSFMCGYLGPNLYIRPSCGECHFNGLPRQADITLADFWGIEEKYDDDQGTSLVLSNTEIGDQWIEKIKDKINIHEKNINDIEKGNVCFKTAVKINPKSKDFLKNINEDNFSEMIKKYSKESIFKKIIKYSKKIINRIKRIVIKKK